MILDIFPTYSYCGSRPSIRLLVALLTAIAAFAAATDIDLSLRVNQSSSFVAMGEKDEILTEHVVQWTPILKQTCKDSTEMFFISGLEVNKNCLWARKKDLDVRCKKHPELRHHCQKSCNTCCDDSTLKFNVADIGEKSCLWAMRKDKRARCSKHPELRRHCPVTCDMCESDMENRDLPPPDVCKDDPGKFYVHALRSKKTCIWASLEDTKWRCEKYPEVKHSCPKLCDTCCKDTFETFSISGISGEKSCLWALKKYTTDRCSKYPELRRHCPDTCSVCGFSTSVFSTFASEM